eukprot:11169555-Lingulodinium_polyedra.AAC.1
MEALCGAGLPEKDLPTQRARSTPGMRRRAWPPASVTRPFWRADPGTRVANGRSSSFCGM